MTTTCANPSSCSGFTLIEMLIAVSIVVLLIGMLMPLVSILRESARRQQAQTCVSQIDLALSTYAAEDPQRRPPPAESDTFIRSSRGGSRPVLLDYFDRLGLAGGLQILTLDPTDASLSVLTDPWGRPYRYVLDAAGSSDPTQVVAPTRPDPSRTDWNARNLVPFGYVWSLGSPVHGHHSQWTGDPDARPINAHWIYVHTTPARSP